MRLQLIRNATLRLSYAGHVILVDPFLADRHSLPTIAGHSPNPTVALPVPLEDVVRGVDLVLVSHLHPDHIDLNPTRLPSTLPLWTQPNDVAALRAAGFADVKGVEDDIVSDAIRITRTAGTHGVGPVGKAMGDVSGFVLRADGEPTVYVAGDTIWTDDVRATIESYEPEVIVTNSGGATIQGTSIIMDVEQTLTVARAAPRATVVAVHLEAYDHLTVTRSALRSALREAGFQGRLLVPEDGESIELGRTARSGVR